MAVGGGVVGGEPRGRNVLVFVKVFLIGPAVGFIFRNFNPVLAGPSRGARGSEVYGKVRRGGKVYDGIWLGGVEVICYAAVPFAFWA